MADKENITPSTSKTSNKQESKSTKSKKKLQLVKSVGLKPADTNKQAPKDDNEVEYELASESQVADHILDILDLTKLDPKVAKLIDQFNPELAKLLDDQDYTTTSTSTKPDSPPAPKTIKKRKSTDGATQVSPQKKPKLSLFDRVSKMIIENIEEVDTSDQQDQKWITINFK